MDRLSETELQNKAFDLGFQACLHDMGNVSWSMAKEFQFYKNTGLTPFEVTGLQTENEQLKELLRLAVEDMHHCDCCEVCKNHNNQPNCKTDCDICKLECVCNRCLDEDKFTWQHANRL